MSVDVNFEFKMPLSTTLEEQEKILEKLSLDYKYDIGGDDGNIGYYIGGRVDVKEVDDEDMPELLKIVIEAGYRIDYIGINYEGDCPKWGECMKKLEVLNGDYRKLWEWISEYARKGEDD